MNYYTDSIDDIYKNLESSTDGISDSAALKKLETYGKNEFDKKKPRPLFLRFLDQIIDPMIVILLFAAIVSAVLSFFQNDSFADVFIIMAVIIINAVLGVYQESKAEKSLEALKDMTASKSKVKRNGKIVEIPSKNLVPGDVVILETGDAVPADGRLIESVSLKVDESALTGESVSVNKIIDTLNCESSDNEIPLADRKNMVYMGTNVVYGRGEFIVCNTGMKTEMGHIAGALNDVSEKKTQLQIKMAQLSKILT